MPWPCGSSTPACTTSTPPRTGPASARTTSSSLSTASKTAGVNRSSSLTAPSRKSPATRSKSPSSAAASGWNSWCRCSDRSTHVGCSSDAAGNGSLPLQGFDHLSRSLTWMRRGPHSAAGGHSHKPRFQHLPQVFAIDAADGEGGERDFGGNLAKKIEAREVVKTLRCGGKRGAAAEVVSAVHDRLPSLLDRVGRDADNGGSAGDAASVVNGKVLLTKVDSVGISQRGQVRPVVHDEQRLAAGAELADDSGKAEKRGIAERLVA